MIKECDNQWKDDILSYIGHEYFKCLYMYIDMQQYGCLSDYTKTWIQENEGEITAVVLAYHGAMHVYSKRMNFVVSELSDFLLQRNPSIICACSDIIKLLEQQLCSNGFISEFGHIGKFTGSSKQCGINSISRAEIKDIKAIAKLLYEDEDIGASYTISDLEKQIKERLQDGFVRSYVIRDNGNVVAHLGTGAEINNLCTISYIITAPQYRGRGLSSSLFAYACKQLTAEGREIYSVYYPENSRRLHHKMGFADCCEFGKLFRNINR